MGYYRRLMTDLWWLLLIVAGGMIALVAVMLSLQAVMGMSPAMLHLTQWAQNLLLMLLPPVLWVRYYKKERVREVLRLRWPGWQTMAWTAALMMVSVPLLSALEEACAAMPLPEALRAYGEQMQAEQGEVIALMLDVDGVWGWTEIVLLMCVMTALGEEALFRGGLLHCLEGARFAPGAAGSPRRDCRRRWMVSVTVGVVFAAIHFEVFGFVPRALLGSAFVWLVWQTGSIWPAVLAHAINNCFALVQIKAAPLWMESMSGAGWVVLSAVACVALLMARPRR